MRVLLIHHGTFPGRFAPVPKECAKQLHRLGVNVEVAITGKRYTAAGIESFAFPIHCIEEPNVIKRNYEMGRLAASFDLVHYFPGTGFELLPLLGRGPKYIFNFISVSVTGRFLLDKVINFLKRLQPMFADGVLFTDEALTKALRPVRKVPSSLMPVGYPSDLFYPCPPPTNPSGRMLVYHGVIRPARCLDYLVKALARLPDIYTLTFVGGVGGDSPEDDEYRQFLAELAKRLNCADRFNHINIPQSAIREVLDKAYLGISYVPLRECYQEQFVIKTLEYLACHRPVLATGTRFTTRFRETIGQRRILLTDGTVDDLVDKIVGADKFVSSFYSKDNIESLSADLFPYSSEYLVKNCLLPAYEEVLGLTSK